MVDEALFLLRWANLLVWAGVAIYLTPSTLRSMTPRSRTLDPLWGAVWFLAVNRVSFAIIALYAPDSWGIIVCFSFALIGAGMMAVLRHVYRYHP